MTQVSENMDATKVTFLLLATVGLVGFLHALYSMDLSPNVILWSVGILTLGTIPAFIAKKKGHDFFPWYIYGVLLFVIALIHSLVMKDECSLQK